MISMIRDQLHITSMKRKGMMEKIKEKLPGHQHHG